MKRPVTLALVASMLFGATAFAGEVPRDALTTKMARNVVYGDNHRPGNDRPGNDRPGNDHRGNDWNNRGNDRHDNDRHDWNNRGNDRHGYDRHDNDRHDYDRHDDHDWNHYRSDWNRHPNYWDNRSHDHVDYARSRYHYGYYAPPRGYYHRTWYRGDRLPYGWYSNSYIVNDWHPYHLYAPPYGYQWVRVGNDVVLTALATGVVLDVLYNIWY
ncbi:MAG TPA: RcnB family protein [Steroidobacteraceae bacterium]|nr:RcnB family protein [Steroidobacteraceae bacterium]